MGWLYYLIEANIYLSILYAFYHFALKQEPLYILNRWYLLSIPIFSFILPFLTVNYNTSIEQVSMLLPGSMIYDFRPSVAATHEYLTTTVSTPTFWSLAKILFFFNLIIILCFVTVTLKEFYKLIMLYKNSKKYEENGVIYIELDNSKEEIFSFFNWLFLHPKMYKNKVIIAHELIHIKQNHSYDVLFFELIRCINWFNPVIYLLGKDAKLNHEYISDRHTSALMQNKYDYANLLIQHAYLPSERLSHSAFSKSQLEHRILQLGKQKAKRRGMFKYLTLFPLVSILFFVAAFKVEKSYGWISFNLDTHIVSKNSVLPDNPSISSTTLSKESKSVSFTKDNLNKLAPSIASKQLLSELVSGPTTLSKIAAEKAKKGEKLYAIDYELFWTINKTNAKIRQVVHSTNIGTEAQLFRGKKADTLYIDQGFYKIESNTVKIKTDNLWISAMDYISESDKNLIVIDAYKGKIIATLDRVDIRTTGLIHSVILNPYFGYGKDGVIDSIPDKYVDVKKRDANRKYISNVRNIYVREAKITANEIITNETKMPNEDLRQPGIIW